jgi:nicotinamide riboside transporter PnuC
MSEVSTDKYTILKKISKAIQSYVSDWKNLLIHAIAGVVLVLVIFVVPLPVYVRIIVFIAVVLFNIWRGKMKNKKKE